MRPYDTRPCNMTVCDTRLKHARVSTHVDKNRPFYQAI
ncbi:hypothetical protein F383_21136 [Gossypium arboreum]|uniref:Uncharacterized protein n=1 Tax=Gossypium arboreum TaxID=29729 RepID=A0A0B0NWX4_GOSAR|nr:hypothetical protein F383_21136 [Gossypium arboreum]